jgi:hypothetical protein
LASNKAAKPGPLQCGDMHKHVGAASRLRDRANPVLSVEKLDETNWHFEFL